MARGVTKMRKNRIGSLFRMLCFALTAVMMLVLVSGCSSEYDPMPGPYPTRQTPTYPTTPEQTDHQPTQPRTTQPQQTDLQPTQPEPTDPVSPEIPGFENKYCYYYDQLTVKQKEVYNEMLKDALERSNEYAIALTPLSDDDSALAALALIYDRPDLYEYGGLVIGTVNGQNAVAIMKRDYFRYNSATAAQKQELRNAVKALAEEAVRNGKTDYERALYVHDYLVKNVEYDHVACDAVTSNPNNYPLKYDRIFTAYGCLIDKKCVCAGYATAYKCVLDYLGIDCVCVCGGNHEWNRITIDGRKYYVDITWDDWDLSEYPKFINHQYFNITTNDLLKDHEIEDYFPQAFCDDTKYNYCYYNNYVIKNYDFDSFARIINAQKDKDSIIVKFENLADIKRAKADFVDNNKVQSFSSLGRFGYYFDEDYGYFYILKQ